MESRNYIANSRIEEILYGRELQNGDRVLIEAKFFRGDPDSSSNYLVEKALESNRWCVVTRLEQNNGLTKFVGLYDNGDLIVRDYADTIAWIVKL
jgi:hypothetical protein